MTQGLLLLPGLTAVGMEGPGQSQGTAGEGVGPPGHEQKGKAVPLTTFCAKQLLAQQFWRLQLGHLMASEELVQVFLSAQHPHLPTAVNYLFMKSNGKFACSCNIWL